MNRRHALHVDLITTESSLNWTMSSASDLHHEAQARFTVHCLLAFESQVDTTSLTFLAKVILILSGIAFLFSAFLYRDCKLKCRNYKYICSCWRGTADLPSLFSTAVRFCSRKMHERKMSRILHAQY